MEGQSGADPSATYLHGDGYIDLRDPDTGGSILNVAFVQPVSSRDPGHYQSSGTYARFARFSRNLTNATIEPATAAIMVNQCLKCHDSDGAQNALARVPGSTSPAYPFGTNAHRLDPYNTGTTYYNSTRVALGMAGGVVDVDSQFNTSNASYHPILGKQNNSYIGNSQLVAPWNKLPQNKTGGNISTTLAWGYLISCWDCHAGTGANGTITTMGSLYGTTSAHGGSSTLRGPVWSSGTNVTRNLCRACHFPANLTSGHGTGSAASSTNSNPAPRMGGACNMCHLSQLSKPGRPIPGEDGHGFDSFAPWMGNDKMWPVNRPTVAEQYKPYAFMRNVGTTGQWRTTSWKPKSGPGVPTGTATCGGGGAQCGTQNHSYYMPGGVY
jgi:cytochrome c553